MDDLISRQAVLDVLTRNRVHFVDMIKITSELKALPPVAPKPKTGKWNLEIEDWNKWTCSNCGWEKRTDIHVRLGYKYCPNCGAKMAEKGKV